VVVAGQDSNCGLWVMRRMAPVPRLLSGPAASILARADRPWRPISSSPARPQPQRPYYRFYYGRRRIVADSGACLPLGEGRRDATPSTQPNRWLCSLRSGLRLPGHDPQRCSLCVLIGRWSCASACGWSDSTGPAWWPCSRSASSRGVYSTALSSPSRVPAHTTFSTPPTSVCRFTYPSASDWRSAGP
jgi:hypothetical protein